MPQLRTHGDALAGLADRLDPAAGCCRAPAAGDQPDAPTPPEAWADVLAWWHEQRAVLVDLFETQPPSAPAWTPDGFPPEVGPWTRRVAHEYAVHRLDLEHAAAGSAEPESVPPMFEPAFAADGLDELFTLLLPPADATVRGPADAVYRAAWRRPHEAATTGNPAPLAALRIP